MNLNVEENNLEELKYMEKDKTLELTKGMK